MVSSEQPVRAERGARSGAAPTLGLRANQRQFWLLVLVNAFVGALVGLERTVLPLLAPDEFGLASKTAILSFIATFGAVKACTNLLAGRLGDRFGRKRLLVAGWVAGVPVPFLVMWAPTWTWIVIANVLLGVNQGLTWSTTVIMKIDLVGPRQRGLAMGLNEFAGYLAVALSALATGWIAGRFGLRPEPFYLGIAVVALGLTLSIFLVNDTMGHVRIERLAPEPNGAGDAPARELDAGAAIPSPGTTPGRPPTRRGSALLAANQAGLVNNLNDGLAWGLFPLLFAGAGLAPHAIGVLAFVYPATWGIAQLVTGAWSDRLGRKPLIAWGMVVQGIALFAIALTRGFTPWFLGAVALGIGTAMAYPTLLAAVGDVSPPESRASSVGAYRFWRDLGYVAGALAAGGLADAFGMPAAIAGVAALTIASGAVVALRMPETARRPRA